jgi:glycosyltransferase involved in cell wall biosynthesis
VLVLNEEDRRRAIQDYGQPPSRVFLFRNGVNPPAAGAAAAHGPETETEAEDTLVFCGSWIRRKGTGLLVAALQQLAGRGLRPRLVLAGTGVSRESVLADWPPHLRDQLEVVESFAPREEEALLRRGETFVLPSLYEGQPLSLLQAMALGRACVGADIPGVSDLIVHGRTGLLHSPGDAAALAACLTTCLTDRSTRRRLGHAAAEAVAARSWPAVAAEVIDFLRAS